MPTLKDIESRIKVSIIIPIYNASEYLTDCLNSLFNQSYSNIQYIFIDDSSTDNSLYILKQATKEHVLKDITIIESKTNEGSACARIRGIEEASGDYITFCDSDDWIDNNAVERLIKKVSTTDADIIASPFYLNFPNKQAILAFKDEEKIDDLNNIPLDFLHFSLCNKLFKASLLKKTSVYPIQKVDCWEDLSIVARILSNKPIVEVIESPYYHYRRFKNHSLSQSGQERMLKDHLIYADYLENWFRKNNLEIEYARFLSFLKFTAKIKMLRTTPRQFSRWKNTYPETNNHILSFNHIPLFYRYLFYVTNLLTR